MWVIVLIAAYLIGGFHAVGVVVVSFLALALFLAIFGD